MAFDRLLYHEFLWLTANSYEFMVLVIILGRWRLEVKFDGMLKLISKVYIGVNISLNESSHRRGRELLQLW
jgi:hypothetical protein